jgi:carbonic anhydrase
MEHIIDGVLRFQREVYPNSAALYRELAISQSPTAMFIGCADSRVVPEVLTGQDPGSLFVVRNAGNIVPPSSTVPGGVTASIEYAVRVLGIPDIIVCGHSGCGAMTAVLNGAAQMDNLPAVARWLHYADAALEAVNTEDGSLSGRLDSLIHENVLTQLDHLLTHPAVADAIHNKQLRVHGWVYDIGSGQVDNYDARIGKFVPLTAETFADATPVG